VLEAAATLGATESTSSAKNNRDLMPPIRTDEPR